jgi:hypothetical protein
VEVASDYDMSDAFEQGLVRLDERKGPEWLTSELLAFGCNCISERDVGNRRQPCLRLLYTIVLDVAGLVRWNILKGSGHKGERRRLVVMSLPFEPEAPAAPSSATLKGTGSEWLDVVGVKMTKCDPTIS